MMVLVKVRCQLFSLILTSSLIYLADGQQQPYLRNTRTRLINRRFGAADLDWDSKKVQVLPPVTKNPTFSAAIIPKVLRNKPPSVHVNYYPEKSTTPKPRYSTPPRNYFPDDVYASAESRPNTVDFAIQPSLNRRNEEKISLNTEYFIKKSDEKKTSSSSTTTTERSSTTRKKRRLYTTRRPPASRIPVLVRKVAKRPKKPTRKNDLCKNLLECEDQDQKPDDLLLRTKNVTTGSTTEQNSVVS